MGIRPRSAAYDFAKQIIEANGKDVKIIFALAAARVLAEFIKTEVIK